MAHVLGIDTSTTATKAILVDEAGAVVGEASAGVSVSRPRTRCGPSRKPDCGGPPPSTPFRPCSPRLEWPGRREGRRTHRPDARIGAARRGRRAAAARHPLERSAHRRRVRRDAGNGRRRTPHRHHRQRRPDRASPPPRSCGSATTSPTLYARAAPRAAPQGLPAAPADRRVTPWTRRVGPAPCCSIWPPATGRRRSWPTSTSIQPGFRRPSKARPSPARSPPPPPRPPGWRKAHRWSGGGGDQAANAVGVGAVREGVAALSLGTSGVVFVTTDSPQVEPEGRLHAFCHAVPGKWHLMGVMLSAAGSLRWFNDELAPGVPVEDLVASAGVGARRQRRADLPALSERRAHPPPRSARPGRLRRPHRSPHPGPSRASGTRGCRLRAPRLTRPHPRHRGGGRPGPGLRRGGTRSALWRQILADILEAEVVTLGTAEGAAYGAAVLAAVGAGWHASVEDATDEWVTLSDRTEPSGHDATQRPTSSIGTCIPPSRPSFHAMTDTGD